MVIYTSKNPWVKPIAYGGLLILILLNRIRMISVFKATFCHLSQLKNVSKDLYDILHYLKYLDKKMVKFNDFAFELVRVERPLC